MIQGESLFDDLQPNESHVKIEVTEPGKDPRTVRGTFVSFEKRITGYFIAVMITEGWYEYVPTKYIRRLGVRV